MENPSIKFSKRAIHSGGKDYDNKRKIRILSKVFKAYCKKMSGLGKNETFEQVSHDNSNMNLNIFCIFLKDFKIGNKKLTKLVKIK